MPPAHATAVDDWMREAVAMQQHPRFPDALARLWEGLMAAYSREPNRSLALADQRHYGVAAILLYLHLGLAGADAPRPTMASLVRLGVAAGIGTRHGIRGIIDRQAHLGFLRIETLATDRRAQRLIPCTALRTLFEDGLSARVEAARLVLPPGALPPTDASAWVSSYIAQLVTPFLERQVQPRRFFPETDPFAHRRAGYLICFALLAAAASNPTEPTPIRSAALSKQLHVSPTQIQKVLRAAENAGLLHLEQRGLMRWQSPHVERLQAFAALELARTADLVRNLVGD